MKSLLFMLLAIGVTHTAIASDVDEDIKPALKEIELVLQHYRAWLESPAMKHVVKGTNHAARAALLIDQYLQDYAQMVPAPQSNGRIGLRGIRTVLLKQLRIHVDLLSTSVPEGIASYDVDVAKTLAEQLDLLEQTLREFERYET